MMNVNIEMIAMAHGLGRLVNYINFELFSPDPLNWFPGLWIHTQGEICGDNED
jgi:prolipoprotein diacylglyceryltransferase